MKLSIFDSPDAFYKAFPTTMAENISKRIELHSILDRDKKLQQVYLQLCLAEPKIAFNTLFFTVNPRKPPGERNLPFILRRPKQEECVDIMKWCLDNQHDMGINKSRDEGATEIVCKMYALYSLVPDSYFIVGSRNKELVDSTGDPYTLMAKIRYAFETMPHWLDPIRSSIEDKDMQLTIRESGSVIRGETTNESFSAGRRATSIFLDEFGRVEPRIAESIEGSVHDVSGCVIYGSTHWFGEHHPFNQALKKPSTKVINLLWYDNPEKSAGLYKSPDYDVIEIVDKDYYVRRYPNIFGRRRYLLDAPFKLSELEKTLLADGYDGPSPKLIADRCENLPTGADLRSPWHDKEEAKRAGNFRDFVSNVWGSPIGSQDSVFNPIILSRIEGQTIRPPKHAGEIMFEEDEDGKIVHIRYKEGGRARLRWWGDIADGRPDLSHNYVIGCDPALGTGNSNSVATIYDVNTSEIVGLWVCSVTPYELFADTVFAMHKWLGEAFVIWENNGGHGVNFGRRLQKKGCHRMYTQRVEDAKLKRTKNKLGWSSTPNSKSDILGELGIALSEGLKKHPTYKHVIIHDTDILSELRGYVYYQDGDIGSSEGQDLTSGARKRHGDRVIATALAVLGSKYQNKFTKEVHPDLLYDSFAYREQEAEQERERMKKINRYG